MTARWSQTLDWLEKNPQNETDKPPQHLYLIADDGETLKIGISSYPAKRLSNIRTNSGRQHLRIVGVWELTNAAEAEMAVFSRMEKYRVCGEWFAVTQHKALKVIGEVVKEMGGGETQKPRYRPHRTVAADTTGPLPRMSDHKVWVLAKEYITY